MRRRQITLSSLLRLLFVASVMMAAARYVSWAYAWSIAFVAMASVYAAVLLVRWLLRGDREVGCR